MIITIVLHNFGVGETTPTRESILEILAKDLGSEQGLAAYKADEEHVRVSWAKPAMFNSPKEF